MSQQLELLTSDNPSQWASVCFVTPDIQKKEIKPFVILALKELEDIPDSRISSLVNADKFSAVRAVVRHFTRLRSVLKDIWTQDDVKTFLEGLRFSSECVAELTTLLCTESLYENVPRHLRIKPGLVSLQWKIDLSLSQINTETEQSSERCKEIMYRDTFVIIILQLTDGTRRHYRLSVAQFHEMRFSIANLLKHMIILEKRKCMRKD